MKNKVIKILRRLRQNNDIVEDYNFPEEQRKRIKQMEELEIDSFNYALEIAEKIIDKEI